MCFCIALPLGDLVHEERKPEKTGKFAESKNTESNWISTPDKILSARFRSRFRKMTIVKCYKPMEISNIEDKDVFYGQLHAVHGTLPKGGIMIVVGGLNAKDERCIDFCNFHRLVIGVHYSRIVSATKVIWILFDQQLTSYQIDHFEMSGRFTSCFLNVHNIDPLHCWENLPEMTISLVHTTP